LLRPWRPLFFCYVYKYIGSRMHCFMLENEWLMFGSFACTWKAIHLERLTDALKQWRQYTIYLIIIVKLFLNLNFSEEYHCNLKLFVIYALCLFSAVNILYLPLFDNYWSYYSSVMIMLLLLMMMMMMMMIYNILTGTIILDAKSSLFNPVFYFVLKCPFCTVSVLLSTRASNRSDDKQV